MTQLNRSDAQERNALVVFLELGAKLPEFARELQAQYPENVVLAQDVTETTQDFAARAVRRLGQLMTDGFTVRVAMLALGQRSGADAFMARHRIATEVARLATPHSATDLMLVGNESLSPEGRGDLKALAEVLSLEYGDGGPNVRLVLESPRRPAGRSGRRHRAPWTQPSASGGL